MDVKNTHYHMRLISFLVIIIAISGCTSTPPTTSEEQEIKDIINSFRTAYNSNDVEGLKSVLRNNNVGKSYSGSAQFPFHEMEINTDNLQAFKYLMWYNNLNTINFDDITISEEQSYTVAITVINNEDEHYAFTSFHLVKENGIWKIDTINKEDDPSLHEITTSEKVRIISERREIKDY